MSQEQDDGYENVCFERSDFVFFTFLVILSLVALNMLR